MRLPYATLEDVRSMTPWIATFTATSVPNGSQVYGFLVDASNELDAALVKERYAVPVGSLSGSTTPLAASTSLALLRTWAKVGAAAKTVESTPQGTDSKHASMYRDQFAAIIKGIGDDTYELTDAIKATSESALRQGVRGSALSRNHGTATPYFRRDDTLLADPDPDAI